MATRWRRAIAATIAALLAAGLLILWWLWPRESQRPWLVLFYVSCDDPEANVERFFLTELRREVLPLGAPSNATFAMLVDRIEGGGEGDDRRKIDGEAGAEDWTRGRLFRVKEGGTLAEERPTWLPEEPDPEMGQSGTLRSFVRFGVEQWGKDRSVALVVCGHGVGARWIGNDVTPSGGDQLTVTELRDALRSGPRLEAVVLYACTMATLETALALPSTRLLVASQELVDATWTGGATPEEAHSYGLDLTACGSLADRPTPSAFATSLIERYFSTNPPPPSSTDEADWARAKTLSSTRLTQPRFLFESTSTAGRVSGALDALSRALNARLRDAATRDTFRTALAAARAAVETFGADPRLVGNGNPPDLVDLSDLAAQVADRVHDDEVDGLCQALEERVAQSCASRAGDDHPRAHGLSIWFPYPIQEGDESAYRELAVCDAWLDTLVLLRASSEPPVPVTYSVEEEAAPPEGKSPAWDGQWSGPGPSSAWIVARSSSGSGELELVMPVRVGDDGVRWTWDGLVPEVRSGPSNARFAFTASRTVDAKQGVVVAVCPATWERPGRPPVPAALEWRLTLSQNATMPASAKFLRCVASTPQGARYVASLRPGDRLRPLRPRTLLPGGRWTLGAAAADQETLVVHGSAAGAPTLALRAARLPAGRWSAGLLLPDAGPAVVVRRNGVVVPPKAQGAN